MPESSSVKDTAAFVSDQNSRRIAHFNVTIDSMKREERKKSPSRAPRETRRALTFADSPSFSPEEDEIQNASIQSPSKHSKKDISYVKRSEKFAQQQNPCFEENGSDENSKRTFINLESEHQSGINNSSLGKNLNDSSASYIPSSLLHPPIAQNQDNLPSAMDSINEGVPKETESNKIPQNNPIFDNRFGDGDEVEQNDLKRSTNRLNESSNSHENNESDNSNTSSNQSEILDQKWSYICSSLKGNSQVAAQVLMKQAAATLHVEEFVKHLLSELRSEKESNSRAEIQIHKLTFEISQTRAVAAAAEQRIAVLLALQESLATQHAASVSQLRRQLEELMEERSALASEVSQTKQVLAREMEAKAKAVAGLRDSEGKVKNLLGQLEEKSVQYKELHDSRSALQQQLRGMLRAEKELSENLKGTHRAIEEQMGSLKETARQERSRRIAAVKRKNEVEAQMATMVRRLH
eukprot:CAMPEP_0175044662 /NCGR_PEP_ID=MMETSP0052_2-20121109/3946_1 /TAXON_ID=51329 ORGANISM="Polytomella parva, Strain SAG 63-3" /NCGR_SAMPLE_ID=MMETSP0052_2 /ASSEMBLY_ACC=CAM_ASM_000194 /LENGTH=465 /DNA_ID=CAMNT_0016308015 /DNA_START=46 /DNA_END=1440 /DNA_ORIENTATION=+